MNSLTPHQSKALNINKSISLTANAGSGKTFVLSQRFLEIILNTDTPLNQVAAITFTEKAAGELYKRISDELTRLLFSLTDLKLKHRVEKIRKQLVSVKISTIHSFCIDLLKEFPVEASIDANFITINEQKTKELINLCIENSFRKIFKNSEAQSNLKLLVRLLGSKEILVKQLTELLNKRKNVLGLIESVYSLSESEIAQHFGKSFSSGLKILFEKDLLTTINHLRAVNEKVFERDSNNRLALQVNEMLTELITTEKELKQLIIINALRNTIITKEGKLRKIAYLTSQLRNEIQDSAVIVEDFFYDYKDLEINDNYKSLEKELAKYGSALINLFQYALSEFEIKKSEMGILDFEDILLKTRKLLRINSVRKSLSGKYKFLLVDEYQDTNEIQYEIFLPLLDDLKNGNLFIVGDEKQSIYRFRDAELQVFNKTKSDIKQIHGDSSLLALPDSFRMAPAICLFVNTLFKVLFRKSSSNFNEVLPSDLVCARSDNFMGQVEFLIAGADGINEAELVAQKIIKLKTDYQDRLAKWSDIAVLVRKRVSFGELQKAFIKHRIPFNLIGGTGFYQRQSISDIYNYCAFLLNDKDDGSLIGVLRSPFFNISDVDIYELSLFEGVSFWEKLKTASSKKSGIWNEIYTVLNENKNLANRVNMNVLLRKILKESEFIAAVSSRMDGIQELSNLNKLLSLTSEFFNEEFNTMYDYVSALDKAISNIEDEAQAGIQQGINGVNILTIHQAKGLEYPAVFLYKCNDYTQGNKIKSRFFTVDKEFGLLTKVPLNENYFGNYESSPIVGLYNLIESKKEIAEVKRLLYVGLTRAEDFLFVTLTDDEKSTKNNSFSSLINQGLNLNFSKDSFLLNDDLSFLLKENETYSNITKGIELSVPITRNINAEKPPNMEEKIEVINRKFILSEIKNYSVGEVISATRYSAFATCPLKYNFLYNYKIGDLFHQSRKIIPSPTFNIPEDYNRNELNSYLVDDESDQGDYSKLKGKIIHYILSKNVSRKDLTQFVKDHLVKSFIEKHSELLEREIFNALKSFYDSSEYEFINSFPDYKNEFEIYLKEEDFYLFGIIDKLLINKKKYIIIDYKTDDIKQNEIINRAEKYLPQLKLYSYIVFRLFNNKQEIEGRIIFLKHPDNPFVFKYDKASDIKIKSTLKAMIDSIRNNRYSFNLSSCSECIFADNNLKCIQREAELIYH